MRIFGAERITGLMERLGMEEDVPIEHAPRQHAPSRTRRSKVEGHNFDIRKNLLDYDDVMNQQRKAIYALRKQILEGRYSPELTEEDKKKGKEPLPPPSASGDWTIDSLAENIKPRVSQIVDGFLAGVTENKDGTVDPYRTDATAPPTDGKVLDPEKLTHELYRQFGASSTSSASSRIATPSSRRRPRARRRRSSSSASACSISPTRSSRTWCGRTARRSRTPRTGTSTRSPRR